MVETKWAEEELEFLLAIQQSPNDDAVRLAYADWLEERCNPLGEFIRLHVELSATTKDGHYILPVFECEGPAERLRQLAALHAAEWRVEPPPHLRFGYGLSCITSWPPPGARFFKGLPIYNVYVTEADFAECFDAASAWVSPRSQIILEICVNQTADLCGLLKHPFAERAVWLHIYGDVDWDQRPPGASVRGFNRRVMLTSDQIVAVASWNRLNQLVGVSFLQVEDAALGILRSTIAPHVPVSVNNETLDQDH